MWSGSVWACGVLGELGTGLCFSRECVLGQHSQEGFLKSWLWKGPVEPWPSWDKGFGGCWAVTHGGTSMAAGTCCGDPVGRVMGIPGLGGSRLLRGSWLCQAEPGDAAEGEQQNRGLEPAGPFHPRVLWGPVE